MVLVVGTVVVVVVVVVEEEPLPGVVPDPVP